MKAIFPSSPRSWGEWKLTEDGKALRHQSTFTTVNLADCKKPKAVLATLQTLSMTGWAGDAFLASFVRALRDLGRLQP